MKKMKILIEYFVRFVLVIFLLNDARVSNDFLGFEYLEPKKQTIQ
jgi:hypothetical protein